MTQNEKEQEISKWRLQCARLESELRDLKYSSSSIIEKQEKRIDLLIQTNLAIAKAFGGEMDNDKR